MIRQRDINIKSTITDKVGDKKTIYYYHPRPCINTISKKIAKKRATPNKLLNTMTNTLNNIIDNSIYKDSKIDLLSIDIEGYEYIALKNFNFDKYNINIIIIKILNPVNEEIIYKSLEYILNSKIYKLLINNNYKMINWINNDIIFIRNDINMNLFT